MTWAVLLPKWTLTRQKIVLSRGRLRSRKPAIMPVLPYPAKSAAPARAYFSPFFRQTQAKDRIHAGTRVHSTAPSARRLKQTSRLTAFMSGHQWARCMRQTLAMFQCRIYMPEEVSMKLIAVVCMAASALSFVGGACAESITEAQVKATLAQMDAAISKRSVDGVTRMMSDDVRVVGVIEMGKQSQNFSYSKDEYSKALYDNWGASSNYVYKRENQAISIRGQKATVQADIKETMHIGSQRLSSNSKEVATLELRGGKLLLTHVEAKVKVQLTP